MSNLLWILLVVILILVVLGIPQVGVWRHNYGYAPSGALTIIVIVLLILLLSGRL